MCGRFTLRSSGEAVAEAFGLPEAPDLSPRFNIAPGQAVAVVRRQPQAEGRQLAFLRWGLIPAWADDPAIGDRLANAWSETAATKPSFRSAFRSRRCLVVADGFYEWQKTNGRKQPYFVGLHSDRPSAWPGCGSGGKSTATQDLDQEPLAPFLLPCLLRLLFVGLGTPSL
jgi:putative SOS response-associated peptidase YedK